MSLWYTDPFDEMRRMQRDMNRVFGSFFDRDYAPRLENRTGDQSQAVTPAQQRTATFWPSVDVKENDNAITVHAELPGMKKDDINITVENGQLSISGERSQQKEEENERFHRVERSYGSFRRSFKLPENVKEENIKASYNDGILTVELPKTAERKPEPKKITVD